MAVGDVLLLSRSDVDAVAVTPNECIDLVRRAMEWQADGSLEVPAKIGIHPPKGRHINAMPAFIGPSGAAGIKWVADFPTNRKSGLPTIHGLIILNDPDTGAPICIMEGALITAKRTAAMTGLSFQVCALPAVTVGTIIGTGTEAISHVATLPKALPTLKTLRIVGRDLASAERFCQEMGKASSVELVPLLNRELAVRDAEIVVTVTNAINTRLLEPNWIAPGTTIAILDNAGKETTILHTMDRIFVDDKRPFATEEVQRRFTAGLPRIDGEVGAVLTHRIQGRRNPEERIIILNLGSAACDVVVATEIFQRAVARKLGVKAKL
jgi:ornithine cyclodeaminase/alanine dehydrogenase